MSEDINVKQDSGYFESTATSSRKDLIDLIPGNVKTVFEVGAGIGKMGRVLKGMKFQKVAGIEINREAALKAKTFYDEFIAGDVEKVELPFQDNYFDCIIYGDVLEHLVDPWTVLKRHRRLLAEDGVIIASIPNIRYYKILKKLVFKGRWNYEDAGILDRTHLRFFTIKTIREMFEQNGYKIIKVIKEPGCSKTKKIINKLFFNIFIDFLVVQYKIVAKKSD
ncbi:MAG: class I SAM-dependent methyltransferase [bacterium]